MTQELIVPVDDLSTVLLPEDHELAPCTLCDKRAAWYFRCAGCSTVTLICNPHRIQADAEMEQVPAHQWYKCRDCEVIYPRPLIWLPL